MWLHCMCAEMIDTNYAPSFKNFIIQRRHLNHYWLMISKLEVSLSRLVFISSKQRSSLSSSLHSFTLVLELKLLLLHDWCCFNHIIMVFDFAAISHQSLLQIVVSHHRITFHVQISTDSIRSDPIRSNSHMSHATLHFISQIRVTIYLLTFGDGSSWSPSPWHLSYYRPITCSYWSC